VRSESRILAVVLTLAFAGHWILAHEQVAEPQGEPFTIVGVVDMPDRDSSTRLPLVRVELDSHFVIRVRIVRILRGTSPWAVDSTLRFLIHSPARMFGQSEIKNERFTFAFVTKPGPAPEWSCKYCVTGVEKDASE